MFPSICTYEDNTRVFVFHNYPKPSPALQKTWHCHSLNMTKSNFQIAAKASGRCSRQKHTLSVYKIYKERRACMSHSEHYMHVSIYCIKAE